MWNGKSARGKLREGEEEKGALADLWQMLSVTIYTDRPSDTCFGGVESTNVFVALNF